MWQNLFLYGWLNKYSKEPVLFLLNFLECIGLELTFNDPDVHIQQRTKENKNK